MVVSLTLSLSYMSNGYALSPIKALDKVLNVARYQILILFSTFFAR